MRKWSSIYPICIAALVSAAATRTVSGQTYASSIQYDIPKLRDVTIDGIPDDWAAQGFHVDQMAFDDFLNPSLGSDFDPRFRLGWTNEGLLICVTVQDDVLIAPTEPSDGLTGDSVVVTLTPGWGLPGFADLTVTPALCANPDPRLIHFVVNSVPQPPDAVEVAGTEVKGGYCIEALIPWKTLGITRTVGEEAGVQVVVSDSDALTTAPPKATAAWLHPHSRPFGYFAPQGVKSVRLSESASPPVKTAARLEFVSNRKPRASIIGLPDLGGESVVARQGEQTLASGTLSAGTKATATLDLPYPRGDLELTSVTIHAGGRTVDELSISISDLPRLHVESPSVQPASDLAVLHVALLDGSFFPEPGDTAATFPEVSVDVVVSDLQGKEVARREIHLGDDVELTLPPRLCAIRAIAPDFYGHFLENTALWPGGATRPEAIHNVVQEARLAQKDPSLAAYAGWYDYLATQIEDALGSAPSSSGEDPLTSETIDLAAKLADWLGRAHSDPDAYHKQHGAVEWAFLSKVDGTGQPFMLFIPEDYDPGKPGPLNLSLRGGGGTHVTAAPPVLTHLEVHAMARCPRGGYQALSEFDLLELLDYVGSHWSIDPDRVHVYGISMGGYGTFRMVARFPDLWASGRAHCGGGLSMLMENALHVPFYAVHSADDDLVPISNSRGATRWLVEHGGNAIQDETDGVGHVIGSFREGIERGRRWSIRQTRVRNPAHVHYTATDELASGAYWVRVAEWGPEGRPAAIDARVQAPGVLHIDLDNVDAARIDLEKCPVERDTPLTVVVNRGIEQRVAAPLPDTLTITRVRARTGEQEAKRVKWTLSAGNPKPVSPRLHFPGGAMALYHGEPLMVVWGTQGDADVSERIRTLASVVRKCSGPAWPSPPENPEGGLFNNSPYTLFGRLPGKPDVEVTGDDMAKCNLLLIGTPEENSLVARLASKFAVQIKEDTVVSNDGFSWNFDGRALGLLHFNPEAPERLVFWVASDSPEFYATDAALMWAENSSSAPPDFLLMNTAGWQIAAARRFDSRWNWERGYAQSPLVPEEACSDIAWSRVFARALRRETGACFALVTSKETASVPLYATGETRQMDIAAFLYDEKIALMDLTGREILEMNSLIEDARKTGAPEDWRGALRFDPDVEAEIVHPELAYRVALPPQTMWLVSRITHRNPPSFRLVPNLDRDMLMNPSLFASMDEGSSATEEQEQTSGPAAGVSEPR